MGSNSVETTLGNSVGSWSCINFSVVTFEENVGLRVGKSEINWNDPSLLNGSAVGEEDGTRKSCEEK